VDLRTGTAQLLGFTLSVGDNGLQIGLGKEAWNRLSQVLLEGHRASDPSSYALKAVDGWITAYGPAFEYRRVDTLSLLTKTGFSLGYRELGSLDTLELKMGEAYQRWESIRDSRRMSMANPWSDGMGMVVTTPSVTLRQGG